MKTWIPLTLAVAIAFVTGWGLGRSGSTLARPQSSSGTSQGFIPAGGAAAGLRDASRSGAFQFSPVTGQAVVVDAAALLEKLRLIRIPSGSDQNAAVRKVIHHLESLAELGPVAVPAIREFLGRFEDVDYLTDRSALTQAAGKRGEPDSSPGGPTHPVRLDFLTPPSLRLGLVNALRGIAGEAAEKALLEVVTTSGRALEVAYAAQSLHALAKNTYRDPALAAAKELLANPPKIENPGLLDENGREYLYSVLYTFGDLSFSSDIRNLLVSSDGSIDRTTLKYLATASPEQAVPVLYQAFKDTRVTNLSERTTLAAQLLSYTGTNQQANDAFHEIVLDANSPSWIRTLSVQSLAGGRGGPFLGSMPTDPLVLQGRIQLLDSLPDFTEDVMNRAIDEAVEKLGNRLATVTATNPAAPSFRLRGGLGAAP